MTENEKDYGVIVNLEAKEVRSVTVTFEEIVRLAFPHKADHPNTTFKVTYCKAESTPHDGTMVEKDHIEIKKDGATSFTVVHATKS